MLENSKKYNIKIKLILTIGLIFYYLFKTEGFEIFISLYDLVVIVFIIIDIIELNKENKINNQEEIIEI